MDRLDLIRSEFERSLILLVESVITIASKPLNVESLMTILLGYR